MKNALILHGGFTRRDNEMNRTFFEEIARDVPDGGMVLICYFAKTEDEDNTERGNEHVEMIRSQAHGKNLQFEFATKKNFPAQVKRADAIFFNGGNTLTLLNALRAFPGFETWRRSRALPQARTCSAATAPGIRTIRHHRAASMKALVWYRFASSATTRAPNCHRYPNRSVFLREWHPSCRSFICGTVSGKPLVLSDPHPATRGT